MKNKKLTYVLLLIVLVVWGMIIYRIFSSASDSDDLPIAAAVPIKEKFDDYSIPKDTNRLLLNYRDPFGLVKQKDTVSVKSRKENIRKVTVEIKPLNWDFIKYSGYVLNPGSKKLIALVSINGQTTTLSQGETKYNVKLIKNLRDSIQVGFNGKNKFIHMKTSAL